MPSLLSAEEELLILISDTILIFIANTLLVPQHYDKPKFLFSSQQCLLPSNLFLTIENVWDKIEKTQLKLLGNMKLTRKAKL